MEARLALTTFYVDGHLQLTADRDASGGLSAGDQVTFGAGQSYQQTHLTYDAVATGGDVATAFSSLAQALASPLVQSGDTIDVAGGGYNDSVVIDKSLTIQGFGSVWIGDIAIDNYPASVTLADLGVDGLTASGVGMLTLSNVIQGSFVFDSPITVNPGQPVPPIYASPLSSSLGAALLPGSQAEISNVGTLKIIRTGIESQQVVIGPGAVQLIQLYLTLGKVDNLWIITDTGSDTFYVSPTPMDVTIDGGEPDPANQPGDTLNMNLASDTHGALSLSKFGTEYSGVWSFGGGGQLHFSNFETLSPGAIVQGA